MIRNRSSKLIIAAAASVAFVASTAPALAHHPLGGMPMTTFAHGVLSGIGHPLLGFDHLFFVVLMGVAALFTGRLLLAPAGYIVAMLAGCLMMSVGVGLPMKEIVIGLSLLTLGAVVLSGRSLTLMPAMVMFASFGLFHGSAFGDSIAAQEAGVGTAVLVGYLIGLGALQYGIAVGAGLLTRALWKAAEATALQPRLAGAMVAGVGAFLTLENLEGFVLG